MKKISLVLIVALLAMPFSGLPVSAEAEYDVVMEQTEYTEVDDFIVMDIIFPDGLSFSIDAEIYDMCGNMVGYTDPSIASEATTPQEYTIPFGWGEPYVLEGDYTIDIDICPLEGIDCLYEETLSFSYAGLGGDN